MKPIMTIIAVLCLAFGAMGQTPAPSTQPADSPPGDVLDRMLRPANEAPKPLDPVIITPPVNLETTGALVVAPVATTQQIIREGTYIVDRTVRLTKSTDGQQAEITFDSDGKSMQDPPMIVVPNLKLEQMESANSGANRDLRFRVTGMVTEYHQRNYVLLEKVVVIPDIVQQF